MLKTRQLILIVLALLVGCASPGPTREDREDVELLLTMLEKDGDCDIRAGLAKLDDELVIRLFGASVLKKGIPKVVSPIQAEFYRLATETNSVPRGKDKDVLVSLQTSAGGEVCQRASFAFNDPGLRNASIKNVEDRRRLAEEIKADRLTYAQINLRFTQLQEDKGFNGRMIEYLKSDKDLAIRAYNVLVMPGFRRIQRAFEKYEMGMDAMN